MKGVRQDTEKREIKKGLGPAQSWGKYLLTFNCNRKHRHRAAVLDHYGVQLMTPFWYHRSGCWQGVGDEIMDCDDPGIPIGITYYSSPNVSTPANTSTTSLNCHPVHFVENT